MKDGPKNQLCFFQLTFSILGPPNLPFLEGLLKGYKMGPTSRAVNGDSGDPISRVINHGPPITTCLEVLMVNNLVFLGLGAHGS